MKKLISVIFIIFLIQQTTAQNYWQQEVNYKITLRLDDVNHRIRAYEEFEYVNNSPDVLDKIYIHLWPNAYKNGETALGKQQYQGGEMDLSFGPDSIKGWIDSLDFRSNNIPLKWELDKEHIDIAILHLPQPLQPGSRIKITTPFVVQIPSGSVSRLGHIGQSYQVTQWYPKPAVYDKNGWHQMPYLNQGEFYSEFGSFDITLTLPKNYVVGATGDLQTQDELDFLDMKVAETQKKMGDYLTQKSGRGGRTAFPASDAEFKTIRYTQSKVHDFAWFADKRYAVSKSEVELPHSKRKVTTWAMWVPHNSNTWQHADEYLRDGTYYYSLWNGDYPYNQVTAVDGTISAGGGMEYPNVTVIGNASNKEELEVVIVHEVGHNWFYGILGTNERVHGWMDEGLNTLNEMRYIQTKYPDNTRLSDMVGGRFHFEGLNHQDMGDLSYRLLAHLGEDQPIETHSACFSPANYGIIMYQKTGLVFHYLKDYLGDELFDKCMHAYYDNWSFKHPQPEDLKAILEKTSGKDLSWLFVDLIQTSNHVDCRICSVKRAKVGSVVKVSNAGTINGPIEINVIKDGQLVETKWTEPSDHTQKVAIQTSNPDQVIIDQDRQIPDLYRNNNTWDGTRLFKKIEPLKMEFLIGDNEQDRTNLFWTPIIGGNTYDKFMIGAALHNNAVPFNKFQYLIAPMYSFGRQMVSGISEFSYTTRPKHAFKTSRFGVSVKSFKNDTSYSARQHGAFLVFSPYWHAKLGNRKSAGPFTHDLLVQGVSNYTITGTLDQSYYGGFVKYGAELSYPDHKLNIQLRNDFIEATDLTMSRVTLESTYRYRYARQKMKRWVEVRGFIGSIYHLNADPANSFTYPIAMSLGGTDGQQDLFFENYYFGRGNYDGVWSQQRDENMGGFKTSSWYGTTTNWMATANLYMDLPIPKMGFIGVFADYGAFHNGVSVNSAINTGFGLRFGKVFGLYLPVWMSKQLNDSFGNASYAEKIRFTLKLNPMNKPIKLSSLLG